MYSILDAAHCHSPAGGQGMNLGLQDGEFYCYCYWLLSQDLYFIT
jgi:hypothetical protein